ncbi:hypothetical protein [Variovorax sp. UC122_21]|uniref:hypothetical protein n=1 Tax=Variovorax sp. UC122_21 TaxID=3374554 RepID=UPI003757DA27
MGDTVEAGQFAGFIHDPVEPWRDARELRFNAGGVVICMRQSVVTDAGDCLLQLAIPMQSPV